MAKEGKVVLESHIVHKLLDKLSENDEFRSLFTTDTAAALRQVGAPEAAARCLSVSALASKEAIRAARDTLHAQMAGELNYNIPSLAAS